MIPSCRSWWRNCALEPDPEIADIDQMEDHIAPLPANIIKIRGLISSLELCHHKAERWLENIIVAIGNGETTKGLGTHPSGQPHPVEEMWQNACGALSAWIGGCPTESLDLIIDTVPAKRILVGLGKRSPLKEWQAQRVVEKIRSVIRWPATSSDPSAQYVWLLLDGSDYEVAYRSQCPRQYQEHEEFWLTTARTIIHDTADGQGAGIPLALAIDMLWPCHWRFMNNLQIVIDAIGGKLIPDDPFAACGSNILLLSNRPRMETVSRTLRAFGGSLDSDEKIDRRLLAQLGEATDVKKWLAASLAKTISLQLHPPAAIRKITALSGPDWIRKGQ